MRTPSGNYEEERHAPSTNRVFGVELTGDLNQNKQRSAEAARELSAKDQDLASLKSQAGDAERLASERRQATLWTADLEKQLDAKEQEPRRSAPRIEAIGCAAAGRLPPTQPGKGRQEIDASGSSKN